MQSKNTRDGDKSGQLLIGIRMEWLQPLQSCGGGRSLSLQLVHLMWSGTLMHYLGSNTSLIFPSVLSRHLYSVHSLVIWVWIVWLLWVLFPPGANLGCSSFSGDRGVEVHYFTLICSCQITPWWINSYIIRKVPFLLTFCSEENFWRSNTDRTVLLSRFCSPAPPSTFPESHLGSG